MPGGIETWLLNVVRHKRLGGSHHDICCVGPELGLLAEQAEQAGARLIHSPMSANPVSYTRRLAKVLHRVQPDVLHVHTGLHSGPAIRAARSVRLPTVLTVHNTAFAPGTAFTRQSWTRTLRSLYGRISLRYAIDQASIAQGVSDGVVGFLQQYTGHGHSSLQTFYLGAPDPSPIDPSARQGLRGSLGLASHHRVLIHVGGFREQKNHHGLLRLFRHVVDHDTNARLLLVGDGPLRSAIEERIQHFGLDDHVLLLGQRADVTDLMQCCEAMVFPSHHEGLPIVVMEAAATRLPVVASDLPGIREATKDGTTALLHHCDDDRGMADSLIRIMNHPQLASSLASQSRQFYDTRFSMAGCVDRLERVYDQLAPAVDISRQSA